MIDNYTLDPKQQAFIDYVVEKKGNSLLTGPAGTGKSFCLELLRQKLPYLHVTGATGRAAANVKGLTIHSWSGIGIYNPDSDDVSEILKRVENNENAVERISRCQTLIIDEVSMLSKEFLDCLEAVFSYVHDNGQPFGGIQMVFVGDFLQIPPVTPRNKETFFAFEAQSWVDGDIKTFLLDHIFRQENKEFCDILNDIRVGNISEDQTKLIWAQRGKPMPEDVDPVLLATHNAVVDTMNDNRLEDLDAPLWKHEALLQGNLKEAEKLLNNLACPSNLLLKEGAQVMLTTNAYMEHAGLCNGSIGVVKGFEENLQGGKEIWVYFPETEQEVSVSPFGFKVYEGNEIIAQVIQFPLRLAWAVTVHKSQGMTIPYLQVDLGKAFEYGQCYVALSRATSLDGLWVKSFNPKKVKAHPKALNFYYGGL